MTTAHPSAKFTEEKYLAIERQAEEKSEYSGGEMFAMAGANREHNLFEIKFTGLIALCFFVNFAPFCLPSLPG